MTTETTTTTVPDTSAEAKINQLRELFADAPEVGRKALESVLDQLRSQTTQQPPPVQSAGRVGSRLGKVSELTIIVPFAPGGAQRLRAFLQLFGGNLAGADDVGTVHDMRFVFLDNDTRMLFATAHDELARRGALTMSSDFVRYSPKVETFDPKLSEYMTRIIEFWEKKVRESPVTEGSGRAVRGAHAKTLGVVRAEVEMTGDAPAAYAQGIYAKPGRHDALIRFSSASNHLGPDAALGPVLGFAMKIFDVGGTKLVDDEPACATFDLVLKNSPVFVANTAKHYLFIQEVGDQVPTYLKRGEAGFRQLLTDFLTGKGTLEQDDWAWEELFTFVKTATQTPVRNPLLNNYWTMAAVRHGEYIAKVRVAAATQNAENVIHRQLDLGSGPDVFGPVLADELKAHAFDFDLQVQLCTDLKMMPVNDSTREWPEKLSPFVTVGRVRIPRQVIPDPGNFDRGDALAFNQWRVTSEHRPLGEIMDVRRVYTASAKVRRDLNHQPQREPASADEVLAWPAAGL